MKVWPPRLPSIFIVFIFLNMGLWVIAADDTQIYDPETGQIHPENYWRFIKKSIPFFTPTEAELAERRFFDGSPAKMQKNASIPMSPSIQEEQPIPLKKGGDSLNDGALYGVKIMEAPIQDIKKEPVQMQPAMQAPLQISKLTDNTSSPVGKWIGEYNKLIEYYNAETQTWREAESSLKNVSVDLDILSNGKLYYRMENRKGDAPYSLQGNSLYIESSDVRVAGQYTVEQSDASKLHLHTQRELIKDKMRVSIYFELNLIQS